MYKVKKVKLLQSIDYAKRRYDKVNPKKNHLKIKIYLTIRLRARVFYEQIVKEAQPS